jgi:hypothetical protein
MTLDVTAPEVGAQIVYDEPTNTWRLVSTGQALPETAIHAEIRRHATLSATMFSEMTTQMYAAELAVDVWQASVLAEIEEAHIANAMFANGGRELSEASLLRVQETIEKEAKYLSGFADDVASGKISELQARARATQYAKAMEQSYWNEWKADITDDERFAHLPLLTQSPGDGGTKCLGNCQCILDFRDDGVWWVQFPADHCSDCDALADGSPYRT